VEQQTIQTQQNPEITEVANGLYFLELSTTDRIIHTQKILIQR
jgi:hypothetical protein